MSDTPSHGAMSSEESEFLGSLPEVQLPMGASRLKQSGGLPKGASRIKSQGVLEDAGRQFLAGVNDVTSLLSRPLEAVGLPGVVFGENGPSIIPNSEVRRLREAGLSGIPGMATNQPTGLFGSMARFAGSTAAAGPILGRAAGLVKAPATQATTTLGKIAQFPQRVVAAAGESFAASPVKSTIVETGLGASAGAGGFFASKVFPDSDTAKFIGEVVGGVAPTLTPTSIALRAAGGLRNAVESVVSPFTGAGGRRRAQDRIQRAASPEQVKEAVSGLDKPTTIDPETGDAVLTPAQRAGAPGLLSLEKSIMESSGDSVKALNDAQIAHANNVIQESLRNIGNQSLDGTMSTIEESNQYISMLLNTNVRLAAQRTDERIAQIGGGLDREAANIIAREELDSALAAAVKQERELYSLIPGDFVTPYRQSVDTYRALEGSLGKAQRSDIPAVARRFLDPDSSEFFGLSGDLTTIKEMRALQSKLREVARNSRAGEKRNLNRARIADDIANSIADDIAQTKDPSISESVQMAVNFSRNLHDRFGKGTVGKILQRGVSGGENIPAGLTLETSLGMSGPKARVAVDDIMKAFDSQESPSSTVVIGAIQDYVRGRFLSTAVEHGAINNRSANNFIKNNEEILKRLPGVRREIEEAIDAGNKLVIAERHKTRIDFDDPRISKATMLIQKGPVETFRQISKLNATNAARETQLLINRVRKDRPKRSRSMKGTTGEALEGLKSGYVEFLLSKSRMRARDSQGLPYISGFSFKDIFEEPGAMAAAKRLFTPDEIDRINIINEDLIRIEKRISASVSQEGVIGDRPSKVIDALAGIAGAAIGHHQSKIMGVGGNIQIPGIAANRFRDLVNSGVRDPASRLIRDAILDEELFRELLMSPLESGKVKTLTKKARARLNAWAAIVVAEHGGVLSNDDE